MRKILHLPRAPGRAQEPTRLDAVAESRTGTEPTIERKDVSPEPSLVPLPRAPLW